MDKFISITILFLFTPLWSYSQNECYEKIEQASKFIDQGKIDEAMNLVRPCIYSSTNDSKAQAFRILSIASTLLNRKDSAIYFAVKMLELNPLYKSNFLNDPKDFTQILDKIDIIPKFSIGVALMYGLNFSYPQVTGSYRPTSYEKKYSNKAGYFVGIIAGYNFNKNIRLDLNLIGNIRKYSMEYTSYGRDYKIDETFNSLDIPLLLNYTFVPKKKISYHILAGPYASILINSYNDLSVTDTTVTKEVKRYSSKLRRNAFNYGIVGGVGFSYRFNTLHLSMDVRYYKGLSNLTKSDQRYENATLIYDYDYLDDDIKLDNLAFNFGFHYYLNYKISK
ncbi:MAG: PorT family protein [Flavobacteriales bacterium]|nr:PorT family protein [Flavobacteriales bacterium]